MAAALAATLGLAAGPARPARAQEIAGPSPAPEPASERKAMFPLWSGLAERRGASLPLPYGVGVVLVRDQEAIFGDHLSVDLRKGRAPPADAALISVAPVTFDNVGATRSVQIKADVWVFPFLNLFASLGKLDGDLAIDVAIDADALIGPPICRPANPCGTQHLHFTSPMTNTTTTFGAPLAYGSDRWFFAATGTRTISIADKDRSDVKSSMAGLRTGPRLDLNDRTRLELYVGITALRLDTEVRGVASLANAFPDGEALFVRYDARVRNVDDTSLVLGVNAEIGQRLDVQGEYNHADGGNRFILSTTYRF